MSRRGSHSSFSSSSDVNFDDLDDQQVFGYLDEDDARPPSPDGRPRRSSADFRLNFSPRISALQTSLSPMPPGHNKHVTRKSVTTTKARSPSLSAKKRIVKRPSSLAISRPTSKLFSSKQDNSSKNERQVTTSTKDSDNDSVVEVSENKEAPASKPRKTESTESTKGSRSSDIAPIANTSAIAAALSSLQAQVELLTKEKVQMEADAATTRTTIENLEHKATASEQSSDLFARQLANVKESFQAKLMAREEEVVLEKMTLTKEKESVVEARELFKVEMKKTKKTLENIQLQASEFAVRQSDRDVALLSRKGRIIQLETQLRNDRQTITQLEAALIKSTRALEKKHTALKVKFQEQKEHLEITLAVRQGLATDLQTKRKQVTELEREVTRLNRAKDKSEVKLKHSHQQIVAIQKIHGHEMEKWTKKFPSATDFDINLEQNNESNIPLLESPDKESEWREFVELVAAYEAERQLHEDLDETY
ncbi:hypothetical protein PHMEG_00024640 [Phytophthora megakarya]|uniref:Uncharacterized protein n=1 Tax=Phytophthora megakarya TaxID=4795 RepID=A0A225VF86_9STRA|nr:hypothetical protein PHMEG_00024640 [Phytophthora megakarya]